MADNKDNQEKIPTPEKIIPTGEQPVFFDKESEKAREIKETAQNEKIIAAELRREIELMQVDDNLKKQAEQKANKISFLADDDKLKNLMGLAREKGIIFAIKVAKSMNDPFILDTLHDALVQEGFYKDFIK